MQPSPVTLLDYTTMRRRELLLVVDRDTDDIGEVPVQGSLYTTRPTEQDQHFQLLINL